MPMKRTTCCSTWLIAALACMLVIFAAASTAHADEITFNITPYSAPDLNNVNGSSNPYTDSISGTLTFNNSSGSVFNTYTFGDPGLSNLQVSGQLTMSTNDPGVATVALPNLPAPADWLLSGSITITPLGAFLSHDGYFNIDFENGPTFPPYIIGEIDPHDDGGAVSLAANPGNFNFGASTMHMFPQNLDATYGIGGPNGAWQIAAIPEPTSLALAGAAVLTLCGLRRSSACTAHKRGTA